MRHICVSLRHVCWDSRSEAQILQGPAVNALSEAVNDPGVPGDFFFNTEIDLALQILLFCNDNKGHTTVLLPQG